MKNYLNEMVDLTGNSYLNPVGAAYGDGSGTHQRAVNIISTISVHHDASVRPHNYDSVARYTQEARAHYDRLGPGLQYHYKIDNTGTIFKIRPLTTWLYVIGAPENVTNLAICLDGYFHAPENQKPTREQYEALSQLLIDLSENHPEFGATYKDIWPHSYFSSTACCGDTLRPYVQAIDSRAKAEAIPVDAVYDWPEFQPTPEVPPVVIPPVPSPTSAWVQDDAFKPASYVAGVNTHLDGLTTGKRFADYSAGWKADFVARFVKVGEEPRLLTAYAISIFQQGKRELAGVPEKDLNLAQVPGSQPIPVDPSPTPTPPVPETPPVVSVPDQQHEQRIAALEALVQKIVAFLKSVFNKKWEDM